MLQPSASPRFAHCSCPKPGQQACGDQCGAWADDQRIILALADGLGHGPEAAVAASAAIAFVGAHHRLDLETLFNRCNEALRSTRGVALAVAVIDPHRQQLTLASVGNIRSVLLQGGKELRLGGCAGIVGGDFNRLAPDVLTLTPGDRLVLYSDGLPEFLPLAEILTAQPTPEDTTRVLVDHYASGKDDVSALAYFHRSLTDPD